MLNLLIQGNIFPKKKKDIVGLNGMPIGGYKLIKKKTLMFRHNHLKLWDCPSIKKVSGLMLCM
jgi:hypothetical protein